jgi:type IV pilus assembly protein PilN
MIRINLLGVERAKVKKKVAFQVGQKLTLACSLILIVTALGLGWRYWSITKESTNIDAELAKAQAETARLHSIIVQVQQYEQRKAQLGQRVALIKQLRSDQTGPVHMLDQISRALPPMVWLTDVKETGATNEVTIEGKCLNEIQMTDFVANLEASGFFKRSIEIVVSTNEVMPQPPGSLVKFTLKAMFQTPGEAAKPVAGAAPAAARPGGAN